MGKVKAKRSKFRAEPTGIPSVRAAQQECEAKPDVPASEEGTHPLVQQMEHEDSNQREFACGALANIVADDHASRNVLPLLVKVDVLRRAVKCLSDSEPGVCAEAAGLLSNIGLTGGPKTCKALLDAGAIPAAVALLRKSIETVSTNNGLDKHSLETIHTAIENSINLIWLLCETSDTALQHFAALSVVDTLVTCLDSRRFPPSVVLATAQCLQTVTEDNPLLCATLAQHPTLMRGLIESASTPASDGQGSLLRVVYAGILYNMRETLVGDIDIVAICLAAIDEVLKIDGLAVVAEALPSLSTAKPSAGGVFAKDEEQMSIESVVDKVKTFLGSQQLALELLTNMCSAEDEADDAAGWEDTDDMGSDVDIAMDEDAGSLISGADVAMTTTSEVGRSVPDRLLASSILPSVLARCASASPHVHQVLANNTYGQAMREPVVSIQTRALASLNNLLMAHDENERILLALGPANVWSLLVDIAAHRPMGVDEFAPDLLEQTMSTLWTLLRRVSQKPALASGLTVSAHEVSAIAALAKARGYEVRECVAGVLGLLAQHPGATGTHADIATVLCALLRDHSLLVVAEALNSIYDAFAEIDHNDAVRSSGMMPALEQALPVLKQRLKNEKKSLDRHARGRVDDALVNLPRFIKYKRPQPLIQGNQYCP